MIDSKEITKFLAQAPRMNGGILEDFYYMLVAARDEMQRLEKQVQNCSCPTNGGDEFQAGRDY